MASNTFGRILTMTSFGESHGLALGVVVDGVPPGLDLKEDDFRPELARRRPGQSSVTSARKESDEPQLLSGVFEGKTTGMPVAVMVMNTGQRSSDYDALRHHIREGHADETYAAKYGHRDHRGGGRSSGRETLARVIAGVIARKILPAECQVVAHAKKIGPIEAKVFERGTIEDNPMRCADPRAAAAMQTLVEEAKAENDSIGGEVEILVFQPPKKLGDPVFWKLKSHLAQAILSVGAVTGFSYGGGFEATATRGRDYVSRRESFGGILGGISTGETIRLQASIKPTTSLGDIAAAGRHDPCIVPRVIPVLEAMTAFVLADAILAQRALEGGADL